MLRTMASPGTFGCHDCRFFHKCTEVTDKANTLPTCLLCIRGRKRAQRPLLRGESSGPQMTPGESPDDISGNFFFPPTKNIH